MQGPRDVTVPTILYHRIDVSPINSRYYVPPQKFEEQMKLLHDWGYTSIAASMLIRAITEGAELPPRPFLLNIDDGNLDNYTNAFPIMQKYGFTGALYLVSNYVGAENYMSVEQVLEDMLGIPILTFAYPYGMSNKGSVYLARFAGYIAAVGLGTSTLQGTENLYYLYRRDIHGSSDLRSFASLLPWWGDPSVFPTDTPVP